MLFMILIANSIRADSFASLYADVDCTYVLLYTLDGDNHIGSLI